MATLIAIGIILIWAGHLVYMFLFVEFAASNPWMYLHIIFQAWLYTGLFITGHDAMHGGVSRNKTINTIIGTIATFMFASMSYKRLRKNHGLHHKAPATSEDPDFYVKSQNFFVWWTVFMLRYLTILQIASMAIIFNVIVRLGGYPEPMVLVYWAVPAILGTIQLFYFGVYWPHKEPHLVHMMPHRARTLKKNHFWALASCYFFGYHYEHHEDQFVPWWKLHTTKKPGWKKGPSPYDK